MNAPDLARLEAVERKLQELRANEIAPEADTLAWALNELVSIAAMLTLLGLPRRGDRFLCPCGRWAFFEGRGSFCTRCGPGGPGDLLLAQRYGARVVDTQQTMAARVVELRRVATTLFRSQVDPELAEQLALLWAADRRIPSTIASQTINAAAEAEAGLLEVSNGR